ncbi:MAG: AAA family ATPase [Pseudomonadota bacterium]
MYTSYFGLTEKPFTITPDPRYLFMSMRHGEALAHLLYGVSESDGFIQLTGEVGTGKTTLIRSLLQQLPDNADIALVLNPQLSAREFLAVICNELNLTTVSDEQTLKVLIDKLNAYLLDAHARGRRTILIVDEAQNLAAEVLEQVRLLTNLETARQKLLQIILIGQPELRDLLARNDLRQLAQRITARYHLEPLSRDEAISYVDHRLRVAGAVGELFSPRAKREVYRLSQGIPRIINVICDRALLGAYVRERPRVDHILVREAAAEIAGKRGSMPLDRVALPLLGVAGALMLALGAWSYLAGTRETGDGVATAAPISAPAGEPVAAAAARRPAALAETGSDNLNELLESHRNDTGTDTAFAALFSIWETPYETGTRACEQATDHDLDCLFLRGSWNVVRQLNRPAILTLTDRNGEAHQVVLRRLFDDAAEILIGDDVYRLDQQQISDVWFGESLLLWRPPNGEAKAYGPGTRDSGVLWLRQSLAAINNRPVVDPDSELFDDDLAREVREYQRERRLQVDGLVGQQTQIIINTDLGLDGTPLLVERRD